MDIPIPCKGDGCGRVAPPQWFCLECENCFCYGCALKACDIATGMPPCPECSKDRARKRVRFLTELYPPDEAAPPGTLRGSDNGFVNEEETGMQCKGCNRGRTHMHRWAGRMSSGSLTTKDLRWLAWNRTPMHEFCCCQCAWNFAWRHGHCQKPSGVLVHGPCCSRGPMPRHPLLWRESNVRAEQLEDPFRVRMEEEDWFVPPNGRT